jgi:hypothetical protein
MKTVEEAITAQKRYKNFADKIKQKMTEKVISEAHVAWATGKKDRAVETLMASRFKPFNKAEALEYCQKHFNQVTQKSVPLTPKTKLSVEQVIAESREILNRVKSKSITKNHQANTTEETLPKIDPAIKKEEEDLQFLRDNQHDTNACLAKMKEMGY